MAALHMLVRISITRQENTYMAYMELLCQTIIYYEMLYLMMRAHYLCSDEIKDGYLYCIHKNITYHERHRYML